MAGRLKTTVCGSSPSPCISPGINCTQCLNVLLTAVPVVVCSIIFSSKLSRVLEQGCKDTLFCWNCSKIWENLYNNDSRFSKALSCFHQLKFCSVDHISFSWEQGLCWLFDLVDTYLFWVISGALRISIWGLFIEVAQCYTGAPDCSSKL